MSRIEDGGAAEAGRDGLLRRLNTRNFVTEADRKAAAAEITRLRAEVELKDEALSASAKVLAEIAGTVLGVSMSGDDHPDPDGALMGVVETCQDAFEAARAALSKASQAEGQTL